MTPTVAEVVREHAGHPAERSSPLMPALFLGVADDWNAGGITRTDGGPEAWLSAW